MSKTSDELEKELDEKGCKIEAINVLFLDVSSTCTGYAIASLNFTNKTAKLTKAGAIWMNPKWEHAEKYNYMYSTLTNYFWIVEAIDYVVVEQYSINPKKMAGILVVPEMIGSIKCAAWDVGGLSIDSILPQSWRSTLGIKPDVTFDSNGKKKRDYKEPTKQAILQMMQAPEKTMSNITGKERSSPSDLYDAIAIGLAWIIRLGFKNTDTSKVKYNTHIGV